MLKSTSITYAKNHLSALLKQVREGSPILLTDYGKPVARLEPVSASDPMAADAQVTELEKKGLVRRGQNQGLPRSFWTLTKPPASHGVDVLDALLDDRRQGR
jgi:prevent-host-death family protein